MAEIPLAVVLRIMKVAGAERANRKAVKIIAEKAEDYGNGVATEAVLLTKLADRKTISANDVKLAAERVNRR
ncbi:MAG TPA: histone [Candidatus Bathyarchaeia archaeon]|nr:histone [Candidatus Bathyarchaeia archaeon]HYC20283.1 histone [Candidatus Bathyarchaeia archaeon]